ncbi:MAG TPA: TonB-dependent receptor [Mucilaginibacter sp.]|jgi:iron complex outermembrane receptor protein|nr:TonB-dependent receptor [Mucilaginibacter sp.]
MDFSTASTPYHTNGPVNRIDPTINCPYRINSEIKLMVRVQLIAIILFAACLRLNAANCASIGHAMVLRKEFPENLLRIKNTDLSGIPVTLFSGKVIDADTKDPLIGASVSVKGTNNVTTTGLDGTFKINMDQADGSVLVISYVGYITKEITLTGKTELGEIGLRTSANAMKEVVVTGDVAIDRKTPIAVSSIGAQFIEEKIGTQGIPELLKDIPGIMATAQGGGYGDGRVSIRGFSTAKGNVAETINGIPVNDPETGTIYWSDYSGLTDVTTSIQVQRGLGASKVIVPSFGGTVNITTRSTDAEKGGYVSQAIGSDGYDKTAVLISTGLNSQGWAATFQGSRTKGNGYVDGLNFLGYNYFFNLSKVLAQNQTLSFTLMGASQTHGQRPQESIANYQNAPQGIRWNYELGVKDGQYINPYNNFFSKPLFSLNHDLIINENSSLSTVLYATYGTGGGGGIGGTTPPRISNLYSPFDYTAVEKSNAASVDGSAGTYLYASHNDHQWYDIRSTYRTNLTKYLDFSGGIDLRYYEGTHYQQVTDLLGADYVLFNYYGTAASGNSGGDINNPISRAVVGDKIYYYNKDYITSEGIFLQSEYSKNDFSAFLTFAGSGSDDKRTDYFNYLNSDPNQKSKSVNFFTYQIKGGANYNISSQMNIFANIGYLTKPPYFGNVFENFTNQVNTGSVPEKLFSYELGYGYKNAIFSAKINLYRSLYKDETFTNPYFDLATNQQYSVNISGVDELHQGIELELRLRPIKDITIGGMLSIGDWYYSRNAGPATVYNNQQKAIATVSEVFLKGLKVGDAAQTTGALFMDVSVLPDLKLGANYNYFGNYTANFDFSTVTAPGATPYKLPTYSTFDLNAVFKFKIANLNASLIATVNNLLDTKYISDAFDPNASGQVANLNVYYGLGRTFTTGLKIKF